MTATTSPLPKGTRVRVHSGLLTAPLECHVIAILKPLPPKQRTHPNASTTRETTHTSQSRPRSPCTPLGTSTLAHGPSLRASPDCTT